MGGEGGRRKGGAREEWIVQARDYLGHLNFILGARRESCVGLRSSEEKGVALGSVWSMKELQPFLLDWC